MPGIAKRVRRVQNGVWYPAKKIADGKSHLIIYYHILFVNKNISSLAKNKHFVQFYECFFEIYPQILHFFLIITKKTYYN